MSNYISQPFFRDLPNGVFPYELPCAQSIEAADHFEFSELFLSFFNTLISLVKRVGSAVADFFTSPAHLVVGGAQQPGATGVVDVDESKRFCSIINETQKRTLLDPKKVSGELRGGACSAMALSVARSMINYQATLKHPNNDPLGPGLQATVKEGATSLHRNLQAAFNTITLPKQPIEDPDKTKIETLSSYFSLIIPYTSLKIDLNQGDPKQTIAEIFKTLPQGTFVIRALLPASNYKGEEHGHSMVLIKRINETLFYDPNKGAFRLTPGKEALALTEFLTNCHNNSNTPLVRFYQVALG